MIATTAAGIALGTLVSEDLACITAGVLVAQGVLDPVTAVAACMLGIYAGDLGLWAAGRTLGSRALRWRRISTFWHRSTGGGPGSVAAGSDWGRWLADNTSSLILGSRFVPGSRLPLYVWMGALGGSFAAFAKWSLVAVALWVPPIVLLTAYVGHGPIDALAVVTGGVWSARIIAAAGVLLVIRLTAALGTRRGRARAVARLSRLWRWEFWPMWLFYAPVAAWTLLLAIRYRGFRTITAANPGIADGGVVGESKQAILTRLPDEWTLPSFLIPPASTEERVWRLLQQMSERGWRPPIVLKPDVGQRGAGVTLVSTTAEARMYLERQIGPVVAQRYHPGPYEAGIFYYRHPDEARGRILSITDKHFPLVVGDGRSTIEDLIWSDRRLRMQARVFLRRHAAVRDHVLAAGERLPLAFAGNHAQGTLFRDGTHLITPALEQHIDRIAQSYDGFFIGRFDVRYSDVERFTAGEDLAIVELNGATAESTNIYDPDATLFAAYRQLFRQWGLVFAIGAANRARGAAPSSTRRLLSLIRTHLTRAAEGC